MVNRKYRPTKRLISQIHREEIVGVYKSAETAIFGINR